MARRLIDTDSEWLLGELPVSVNAVGSTIADSWIAGFGYADTAVVTLCTMSGRICTIESTKRYEYGFEQSVELLVPGGPPVVGLRAQMNSGTDTSRGEYRVGCLADAAARYATAYRFEMDHFLQVAVGRAVPEVDGRAGRLALALAETADRSWRIRQQIKFGESQLKGE